MHYLYGTEKNLRAFLHNVSCRLEPGGFYIGTTVDAEKVVALMRTEGGDDLCIQNKYYSIRFGQDTFAKVGDPTIPPYGLKFYFYLHNVVGRERLSEDRPVYVPEYLVPFDHLQIVAREYGLELVEKKNFIEFYQDFIDERHNRDLFDRMVTSRVDGNMT